MIERQPINDINLNKWARQRYYCIYSNSFQRKLKKKKKYRNEITSCWTVHRLTYLLYTYICLNIGIYMLYVWYMKDVWIFVSGFGGESYSLLVLHINCEKHAYYIFTYTTHAQSNDKHTYTLWHTLRIVLTSTENRQQK